ncbi:hypothetical protein [Streptomyces sp. SDr-06]|uniref:hypothetical protein n=1 Tax=Streptomyces sp. SDr-06 TaxID=2267702 RepID=UPI003982F205
MDTPGTALIGTAANSTVVEIAVDGEAESVPLKLGVWLSNTKARRDKLTVEQPDALRTLGMAWAWHSPRPVVAPDGQARCTKTPGGHG